jgi:two-component system, response regulator
LELAAKMSHSFDILIVDDSPLEADLTTFAVRRRAPRAAALWLDGGDLALQYLRSAVENVSRSSRLPRLILLELDMPVVSGLCVLDVIRALPATRSLPAVILGRSCDPTIFGRGDMFDADAYVQKSSDHEEYCEQIAGLIDRWLPEESASISCSPHQLSNHQRFPSQVQTSYGAERG